MPNYTPYYIHSDCSLLDSCTKFEDYIQKAASQGQTAIGFTEHGKPLKWIDKKMKCTAAGLKYLHGVECYLTESHSNRVRDNFHTVLIAKNYDGVLELNQAISTSCQPDHFYFVNRLSFEEFFSLSKNIIKISACLASPLNKLPVSHPEYGRLVKAYDYLEIQPHNHPDQISYNVHLATLADKYGKKSQGHAWKDSISKTSLDHDPKLKEIVCMYATDKNEKGTILKSYRITDRTGLLSELDQYIHGLALSDYDLKTKMAIQLELLGYVDLTNGSPADRTRLLVTDIYPLSSKDGGAVWGYAVFTKSIGSGKCGRVTVKAQVYSDNPIKKMDILRVRREDLYKNKAGYWYITDYKKEV